ncbi:MAG: N-acetylmuramoyl-L-alanine amidase, partial [Bacteroidota bacterium]
MLSRRAGPVVSSLLVFLLSAPPVLAEKTSLTVHRDRHPPATIRALERLDVVYLAVNDLIGILNLPFGESTDYRKLEFRIESHRLKVTAGNPFLVITDINSNQSSVYQISVPAVYTDRLYYVPVLEFVRVVSIFRPDLLSFDEYENVLTITSAPSASPFDITGIDIETRLNGYLMTIRAARRLGDVEAWLKPDGWLFVTVANAKADTVALSRIKPYGAIRRILTFQSPTAVQLTFRVAPDVIKADLLNEPGTNNLMISLHTQSEAEKADLEKRRQAMIKENLERGRNRWKLDVIVLDAGHGGKDPGTIGVAGTKEKDVTLAVTLKLGALIERNLKDVKVVYTRKTDTFVELYRRTQIANEAGGKLFISIHCNSTERKPSNQNG